MPIIYNGETFSNGGSAIGNLGNGDVSLSAIMASIGGAEPVEVWRKAIICTDLVNWYGWTPSGHTADVNTKAEGTLGNNGLVVYSGASSAASQKGSVTQSINMVNGHKYWFYTIMYASDSRCALSTPFGSYSPSYGVTHRTINSILTYSGNSGASSVLFTYTGTDDSASQYCRLCCLNIVDLTASFGSGNEPTAEWCLDNLGIFDGSKTIIPS